jgi:hypothetical protein
MIEDFDEIVEAGLLLKEVGSGREVQSPRCQCGPLSTNIARVS